MNKPSFDPNQLFESADSASKPEFDASKPFEVHKMGSADPEMREKLEPGIMDETAPPEQKALSALNDVGTGFSIGQLPAAAIKYAGKAAEFLAPQAGRIARNQTMKGLGGSMAQIRQMATKGDMDQAAQFANDKGLNDVFSTSLGRENLLKNLESETGKKIGGLREEAGTVSNPDALSETVNNAPQMRQYLGKGLNSGQAGDIPKALDDVKRIEGSNPGFNDRAKAATFLNQSAAGSKLYQPSTATTDIANIISKENNASIRASLGPAKAGEYDTALSDYHQIEPLKHLQDRGDLREMSGRGGGGFVHSLTQGVADSGGYRATAKGAFAAKDALENVAGLGKAVKPSVGGVTTQLMSILSSNPQQLGKYAAPLLKASQTGGNQGLAATHYLLSSQYPEYNQMVQGKELDKAIENGEGL